MGGEGVTLCPLNNDFPFLQSEGCPTAITGKEAPAPLHPPESQLSLIPQKAVWLVQSTWLISTSSVTPAYITVKSLNSSAFIWLCTDSYFNVRTDTEPYSASELRSTTWACDSFEHWLLLCWAPAAARAFSGCGGQGLLCSVCGLLLGRLLLLRSTGSRVRA